jgi:farnesyl diphosphate synthase
MLLNWLGNKHCCCFFFDKVYMQTTIGQSLDLIIGSPQEDQLFDFKNYTEDTYNAIVKWKTAYYSFYLPVACALYLVGGFFLMEYDVR